jgi:hypothetical protein
MWIQWLKFRSYIRDITIIITARRHHFKSFDSFLFIVNRLHFQISALLLATIVLKMLCWKCFLVRKDICEIWLYCIVSCYDCSSLTKDVGVRHFLSVHDVHDVVVVFLMMLAFSICLTEKGHHFLRRTFSTHDQNLSYKLCFSATIILYISSLDWELKLLNHI